MLCFFLNFPVLEFENKARTSLSSIWSSSLSTQEHLYTYIRTSLVGCTRRAFGQLVDSKTERRRRCRVAGPGWRTVSRRRTSTSGKDIWRLLLLSDVTATITWSCILRKVLVKKRIKIKHVFVFVLTLCVSSCRNQNSMKLMLLGTTVIIIIIYLFIKQLHKSMTGDTTWTGPTLFSAYSGPSKITYTNMSTGQWYTYNIPETHKSS